MQYFLILLFLLPFLTSCNGARSGTEVEALGIPTQYDDISPNHQNIEATLFWIGEKASGENGYIANAASFWDDAWLSHYGGVDDPQRETVLPSFTPGENPFYFALPYSDFDDSGERRSDASKIVPWAKAGRWDAERSMLKNHWIEIRYNGKSVYAQWEDAGPFAYDDAAYVFGHARPRNEINDAAGLDLSPAVWIYLGFDTRQKDISAKVAWRFIEASQVPDGPWKSVVTSSDIYWQ